MQKKQSNKKQQATAALVFILIALMLAGTDSPSQCSDGIDNDGDGFADMQDPDCIAGGSDHDDESNPPGGSPPPGGP